jgi:hypothetical protein
MTPQQVETIKRLRQGFKDSCEKYSSWGSNECHFSIYTSGKEDDKNITLIITTISGISDSLQPYFETTNLLVEPNGNSLNLLDFFDSNDVLGYIENLKKLI